MYLQFLILSSRNTCLDLQNMGGFINSERLFLVRTKKDCSMLRSILGGGPLIEKYHIIPHGTILGQACGGQDLPPNPKP